MEADPITATQNSENMIRTARNLLHKRKLRSVRPPGEAGGIEEKSAYLVGSGLASLAAACFLVRDAQMPGKNIHILEAMDIAGGACDGIDDPTRGYVMRGGREMEDHFECLWDLFHSIRPWRFQARPFSMSITG